MNSWADHCSSDEEEDDIPRVSTLQSSENLDALDDELSSDEKEQDIELEEKSHSNLPSEPPYTAFVGNLSFDIQDAKHLAYELEEMCEYFFNRKVTAVDGRLMTDKETGKKKGFGYVEFETIEDVSAFLSWSICF